MSAWLGPSVAPPGACSSIANPGLNSAGPSHPSINSPVPFLPKISSTTDLVASAAASNAAIQSKAFSLDVRADAFFEATDASKFKDAVRPSSNANELWKFERYWKSGGVEG